MCGNIKGPVDMLSANIIPPMEVNKYLERRYFETTDLLFISFNSTDFSIHRVSPAAMIPAVCLRVISLFLSILLHLLIKILLQGRSCTFSIIKCIQLYYF